MVRISWTGSPGRRVEVLGDFPSWKRPLPMKEVGPGCYALELELASGIYRYKLRVDGQFWIRDPNAHVVDIVGGFDNGELIVGGIESFLYFVFDRCHFGCVGGGFRVYVEVQENTTI